MKNILVVALLLAVVSLSSALISEGFFTHPDHPGKCVTREGLVLAPREKVKDPNQKCGLIECVAADGFTAFYTCDREQYDNDSLYGEYKYPDREYPDCCIRKPKF